MINGISIRVSQDSRTTTLSSVGIYNLRKFGNKTPLTTVPITCRFLYTFSQSRTLPEICKYFFLYIRFCALFCWDYVIAATGLILYMRFQSFSYAKSFFYFCCCSQNRKLDLIWAKEKVQEILQANTSLTSVMANVLFSFYKPGEFVQRGFSSNSSVTNTKIN